MAEACGAGGDLDRWLAPFLDALGHERRRTWAPLYLRGLMGPGERKSPQPMAARLGLSGHDQLHHFVAGPAWDDGPPWAALAEKADRLPGGPKAVLVIDDTAPPKKGTPSAGVARRYRGQLGEKASRQALVSLTPARGEVPVPIGPRLFLPDEWTRDPDRCARAGVPEAEAAPRSKGEVALAELDRVLAAGVRFGVVPADAGYGASAAFRHGLDERRLPWAVGIPRTQKVYGTAVRLRWPRATPGGGLARRRCRARSPARSRRCWPAPAGAAWAGGGAPRGRWPPASRPSASGSAAGRSPAPRGTCPARKPGWWASGAATASGSTTSAICPPARRCARSPRRSRRAGRASRRTSSSGRSWARGTSRGGPGRGCTGTRRRPASPSPTCGIRVSGRSAGGGKGGGRRPTGGHHRSPACPPSAAPSSAVCPRISSRRSDVRTAGISSSHLPTLNCPGSASSLN